MNQSTRRIVPVVFVRICIFTHEMSIPRLINVIGIALLCLVYTGAKPLHYLLDSHQHAHHHCSHDDAAHHDTGTDQSLNEHHDCQLCDLVLYSFVPPSLASGIWEFTTYVDPGQNVPGFEDLVVYQAPSFTGSGRAPPRFLF
jgi:hypothetical protein